MDEQNWLEKLGIVRDIGDIKTELVRMTAAMQESNRTMSEHHKTLYGDGGINLGVDKTVDRLNELEKGRAIKWGIVYTALGGLLIERLWALITHSHVVP